jgi:putative phage-type endonuclease
MSAAAYQVLGNSADRADWLRARQVGIGGSEIAAVLGESPHESALGVYARKVDNDQGDDAELAEHMFWGLQLEAAIAEGYSKRTERPFRMAGQLLQSTEYPWMLVTLDGWTGDRVIQAEDWPLEVKNVGQFMAANWQDGPPRHIYLQAQQQLIVTGTDRVTVAGLAGGNKLMWQDVERDDVECRRIIHQSREFWQRVQNREPPPPDGSDASKRALLKLYPEQTKPVVALPAELVELDVELQDLKERLKVAGERRDWLENQIRAALGDHEVGLLPDGSGSYSWKAQTRKSYVVQESTTRVLRRHKR